MQPTAKFDSNSRTKESDTSSVVVNSIPIKSATNNQHAELKSLLANDQKQKRVDQIRPKQPMLIKEGVKKSTASTSAINEAKSDVIDKAGAAVMSLKLVL